MIVRESVLLLIQPPNREKNSDVVDGARPCYAGIVKKCSKRASWVRLPASKYVPGFAFFFFISVTGPSNNIHRLDENHEADVGIWFKLGTICSIRGARRPKADSLERCGVIQAPNR
jgi:hypothetical protein